MSSKLNNQITGLNEKIMNLQNEVSQIDANPINPNTNSELAKLVAQRKERLVRKINALDNLKKNVGQSNTNHVIGFNGMGARVVADIKSQFGETYTAEIDKLKQMNVSEKDRFYQLYNQTDSRFLKEVVIKSYFH